MPRRSTALEEGLAEHGYALADIELLLLTHHHLDHAGLAQTIRERSGATVAAHRGTAEWGAAYHERARAEHRFSEALMLDHGVPEEIVAGRDAVLRVHHPGQRRLHDRPRALRTATPSTPVA